MTNHSRCSAKTKAETAPPCRTCSIVGPQAWVGAEEHAARLEEARTVRRHARGAWLFRQGEPAEHLFSLIEGAVVISRDDGRGEAVAVHLATPGTTLGFRGLIEGGRHGVSAQCATRALVCSFPVTVAESAMAASRALEGIFFHHMADELSGIQDRMLRMATLGVRDRMVLLLGQMIGPFGRDVGDGALLITTPVSRMDMGALAGMTPETVSRCIRTLEAEHLVHFTRRHILIPNRQRFTAELARLGAA
jgi:CRP-like cAMP-binding protein